MLLSNGRFEAGGNASNASSCSVPISESAYLATVTIQDDGDAGTVGLQFARYSVRETNGSTNALGLTLTRVGREAPSGDIFVVLRSRNITATAGLDYEPLALTLPFAHNTTTTSFHVTVLDDALYEVPDEEFAVFIDDVYYLQHTSPPNPYLLTTENQTATVTILDDGDAGTFQFIEERLASPESAGGLPVQHTLTVTRTGRSRPSGALSVRYESADDSARAGSDYNATAGWLEFADGQTRGVVVVGILDDEEFEYPDERFRMQLTAVSYLGQPIHNVHFGESDSVFVTIVDDGDLGLLRFEPRASNVTEGNTVHLTVTRYDRARLSARLTVRYASVDLTAKSSGQSPDYTGVNGTLDFSGATTNLSIPIATTQDEVRAFSRARHTGV